MTSETFEQHVRGGVVHKLPADLRKALIANTTALAAWTGITPLACARRWPCRLASDAVGDGRRIYTRAEIIEAGRQGGLLE